MLNPPHALNGSFDSIGAPAPAPNVAQAEAGCTAGRASFIEPGRDASSSRRRVRDPSQRHQRSVVHGAMGADSCTPLRNMKSVRRRVLAVLFALGSIAYFVKSIRNNSDSFWSDCGRLIPTAGIYFVLTGVSIIVSQMMDKGRSIDEIFGGSLDTSSFRMYTEECLEIYVSLFLVCAFFAAHRTFGGVGNRFPALWDGVLRPDRGVAAGDGRAE